MNLIPSTAPLRDVLYEFSTGKVAYPMQNCLTILFVGSHSMPILSRN